MLMMGVREWFFMISDCYVEWAWSTFVKVANCKTCFIKVYVFFLLLFNDLCTVVLV